MRPISTESFEQVRSTRKSRWDDCKINVPYFMAANTDYLPDGEPSTDNNLTKEGSLRSSLNVRAKSLSKSLNKVIKVQILKGKDKETNVDGLQFKFFEETATGPVVLKNA